MHNTFTWTMLPGALALLAGTAAATAMALPAAAVTSHAPARVYVSAHGTARALDTACSSAAFSSIPAAMSTVAPGGTVIVCGGTYHEDISVIKPLKLQGEAHATIDAAGKSNGILVTAPRVRISGFTITGATGEGILAKSVRDLTIAHNVVAGNDLGGIPGSRLAKTYPECVPQGAAPADCGEGIHLEGTSFSTVVDNTVKDNTGGVLLTDETGPASHDAVIGNVITGNPYACGVTVVGHNPAAAPKGVPAPKVAGVYDNLVSGNKISDNGTKLAGAGVVLATALPGGAVYDNLVEHNTVSGDGLAGVTLHSHVPGQFLNGNVIVDNLIDVNNLLGDPDFAPHVDNQTTGILAATVTPLSAKISGNKIVGNHFGIWTTGPVTANIAHNVFDGDKVAVARG
jgi:parallel beta-helix repeat protein